MYLNHLQIVNYKNLKATNFQFHKGANTIIGENDSGKSNAVTALRILLDDSYYYNTKRLKESDFSDALGDWKGHWIIISAVFAELTTGDKTSEICSELAIEQENENFLKSYIKSEDEDRGTITVFIRPQKCIRRNLYNAENNDEFHKLRKSIRLSDYEFYFTARSQTDFTIEENYINLVGNLGEGNCSNPDDDDEAILGSKLNIGDVQNHISLVFIDALRDVAYEMRKPKNPIRRIVESIENLIDQSEMEDIKAHIIRLNESISGVNEISKVGDKINRKLLDMIGMVYSPEIILESQLSDDLKKLSKYLTMKPSRQNDIELLGLGHLNIIYMALKIIEYEVNRSRELINIMIIEEPEAHIHTHIQKTLFDKLNLSKDYTQVIMTTHSTHLSEVAAIKKVNIMKAEGDISIAMNPTMGLDKFGQENLELKNLKLSKCIERYLDAKRNVLLFSKGVVLVEGDGEEILIPNMIEKALGVTLDELGLGIINVGSTSFEYIASLFDDERINRYCAIITDLDKQLVNSKSSHYKETAEAKGTARKNKLDRLYCTNSWVQPFFAESTLETEFSNLEENRTYIEEIIELNYKDDATKKRHKEALENEEYERANSVLTIAKSVGKGWYATLLSSILDDKVQIPEYILEAIAFASIDVINIDMIIRMISYSLSTYEDCEEKSDIIELIKLSKPEKDILAIKTFISEFEEDMVEKFIMITDRYKNWFGEDDE